ncbi:MAG TPA: CheR family methyltransferase, partial [Rubricoccaceae bacterium]
MKHLQLDRSASQNTPFVVVGLGASAGGLEALESFFSGLPTVDSCAFVVVIHLSPDRESEMAEILGRVVPVPVVQVAERVTVEKGHVYVIPPDRNLHMEGGHLWLTPLESERRKRRPVDYFFRTLAGAYGDHAVAVVLSGTGHNGTVGARAIKEAGGLVLAQDPDDAEYDEMPRTAIASGIVDRVGAASALGAEVVAYSDQLRGVRLPTESPGALPHDEVRAVQRVLAGLRARTGHDFAHYKRSTVLRRLERRLHVVGVASIDAYADHLRGNADEARELLKDLLISVTNFFRDSEAFEAFEREVVPRLFEGKGPDDPVRVWTAGCATGEEAYSVAMLLLEHAATLDAPPAIQVFGTDLSERAIRTAREGVYPESIEADVSPERLGRFFRHDARGYRVTDALREAVLFAPHSLLKDPPFSHVDAVTCRNVLIYFQRTLQQRALELFHYALEPGGYLFLGTSETTDVAADAFHAADKANRIYQRREGRGATALPLAPARSERRVPVTVDVDDGPADPSPAASFAKVHQRLRAAAAPPSILVTEANEVVHLSDGAGPFLQHAGGEPTRNVVRLVRPELRVAVQTALLQASRQPGAVTTGPNRIDLGGVPHDVRLRVQGEVGLYQVLFDAVPVPPGEGAGDGKGRPDDDQLEVLRAKHQQTSEQLQIAAEEFETSREELQAQNEELQSTNEELRSTAEELETSKEEAQSMAEELMSVNDEMKVSVEELSRARSDLENLIVSTEIGTLFLDRRLAIKWFSPQVRALFHVRASDIGRPLSDLAPRFGDVHLVEAAEDVLDHLQVVEREVGAEDGRWHLVHVRPYRSIGHVIDGVVVTFVDITERKRAEAVLQAERRRAEFRAALADALRPLADPVEVKAIATHLLGEHLGVSRAHYGEVTDEAFVVVDRDYTDGSASLTGRFRMDSFNPALTRAHGAGQVVVMPDVAKSAEVSDSDRAAYAEVGVAAQVCAPLVKGSGLVAVLAVHQTTPRVWTAEEVALVAETAERMWEAIDRARTEAALRESEERFRLMADAAPQAFWISDADGRNEFFNRWWADYSGVPFEPETVAEVADRFLHPDDAPAVVAAFAEAKRTGRPFEVEQRNRSAAGEYRWFLNRAAPYRDPHTGEIVRWYGVGVDIHDRKTAEAALARAAARDEFSVRLADALRASEDAAGVQAAAARVLGEHFNASRVHYAEFEDDGVHAVVAMDYARGVQNRAGRYRMADFALLHDEARAGRTFVVPDVPADPRLSASEKEVFAELPVAAIAVVPLVKGGRLVAVMAVHHSEPHAWTPEDVALFEETAERTWAAVEQTRAEAALRESEKQYRALTSATSDVLYRMSPDWSEMRQLVGGGFLADTEAPRTDWAEGYIHPDDRLLVDTAIAEAIQTRGVFELEHRVWRADGTVGWTFSRAVPLLDEQGEVLEWFGAASDITARRQAEAEVRSLNEALEGRVAERTAEVHQLAARLTVAEQEERQRIAHLLHDDLQQQLYGLSSMLTLVTRAPSTEAAGALASRAAAIVDGAIQMARSLAAELSPTILQAQRLRDVLEWIAKAKGTKYGLEVEVEVRGDVHVADPAL